jgi:hypothetical protein
VVVAFSATAVTLSAAVRERAALVRVSLARVLAARVSLAGVLAAVFEVCVFASVLAVVVLPLLIAIVPRLAARADVPVREVDFAAVLAAAVRVALVAAFFLGAAAAVLAAAVLAAAVLAAAVLAAAVLDAALFATAVLADLAAVAVLRFEPEAIALALVRLFSLPVFAADAVVVSEPMPFAPRLALEESALRFFAVFLLEGIRGYSLILSRCGDGTDATRQRARLRPLPG